MGWNACGNKDEFLKIEMLTGHPPCGKMAEMDRIENAAENSDRF
jgi:hypothetical protein